ncbi:hypothetical protein M8818_002917 [Zalaria obscura]|uniref:Uncharacterized protein n=1 Tax=Zalaria obscura TaxID=2024903 RepID=A0ACC3SHN5_9PEZI
MYTCKSSTLTPLPADSLPFTLTAVNPSAPFNGKTIEASSEAFYIGRAPSTYCPVPAIPAAACAAGNTTVMYGSGLATTVPGGQEIYIQSTGALAFTQAHSAATYNLSSYSTGPVYEGGAFFAPNGTGWTACPVAGSQGVWQVFAKLAGLSFASDCVGFYAKVHDEPAGTVGAWQYV